MTKEEAFKTLKEMLKEINDLGYDFNNLSKLARLTKKDKGVIPIYLKYLFDMPSGSSGKLWIVRYMNIRGMSEFSGPLLDEFMDVLNVNIRWDIASTLYTIGDQNYADDYLEIIKNDDYGRARQMIILLVGKLRIIEAIPELIRLLNDDDCSGHCVEALGNYDDISLISYIEPFLNHEKEWIRKTASKSIRDIRKRCSD